MLPALSINCTLTVFIPSVVVNFRSLTVTDAVFAGQATFVADVWS